LTDETFEDEMKRAYLKSIETHEPLPKKSLGQKIIGKLLLTGLGVSALWLGFELLNWYITFKGMGI
jgi:hypothetical protein